MSQQRDQAIQYCFEVACTNFNAMKGIVLTDLHITISNEVVAMSCPEFRITQRFVNPKPTPPIGTPLLAWEEKKQHALFGISTGELEYNGKLKVNVQGQVYVCSYSNWSIMKEVEETP
jgi:hypothetical protein